jgi:hypothetical protein
MIKKFGRAVITFDLDAQSELKARLERIGLKHGTDFFGVGLLGDGNDCLEGLVPVSTKRNVWTSRPELITRLSASDSDSKKSAKSALKQAYVAEFKLNPPLETELKGFRDLFKTISKSFT